LEKVKKVKAQAEKAKEEFERAKEEAKQHGYNVGVAKTEDALRAKVPGVCGLYCAQVWDEALNQARVKASSMLRKVESVYYPEAICASSSSSSKVDIPPKVADLEKNNPEKVPPSSGSPPKVVEQPGATEKEAEASKGVAPNATMPPAVP